MPSTMKKLLSVAGLGVVLLTGSVSAQKAATINGAGATFPYPVYSKWAYKYNELTGVKMNYQSIGSGGGIAQIKAKTVDFGASDAPLKKEELEIAKHRYSESWRRAKKSNGLPSEPKGQQQKYCDRWFPNCDIFRVVRDNPCDDDYSDKYPSDE